MTETDGNTTKYENGQYKRKKQMKKYSIYVLLDPETKDVKYVGRTKSGLEKRLAKHIVDASGGDNTNYLNIWIKSLIERDLLPEIELEFSGFMKKSTATEMQLDLIEKYVNEYCLINSEVSMPIIHYTMDGEIVTL